MSPDWIARASTPEERMNYPGLAPGRDHDQAVVEDRRKCWIESASGGDEASFYRLLARRGIDKESWLKSLRDHEVVDEESLPEWARSFSSIWERLGRSSSREQPAKGHPVHAGFRPWYSCAEEDLIACARRRGLESVIDPGARKGMLDYFVRRSMNACWQAVSSLRIEELQGDDPGAVCHAYWRRVYDRYPVLVRLMTVIYRDWINNMDEMMMRLSADLGRIERKFFSGNSSGVWHGTECGTGDPHDGGRSVAVLSFERGNIVYKPKRLGMTDAFVRLIERFSAAGPSSRLRLKVPDFMECGQYGWEEWVPAKPCASRSDGDLFYARLGAWQRLLELMGAADYWFDNLLASAAQPVFIDHEMLLQPKVGVSAAWPEENGYESAGLNFLTLGILPLLIPGRIAGEFMDISCMAPPGWHETPLVVGAGPRPDLQERYDEDLEDPEGTSDHRRSRISEEGCIEWYENRHAPRFDGQSFDARDHWESFERGYTEMQAFLRTSAARNALDRFVEEVKDKGFVRYIPIDTWTCYSIGHYFTHPGNLGDGVRQTIAQEFLWHAYGHLPDGMIESAIIEFTRGDVPFYTASGSSCDVRGTEGIVVDDFFERDALSMLKENIAVLGSHDTTKALELLRAAFSTRPERPRRSVVLPRSSLPLSKESAVEAAAAIGDAIMQNAPDVNTEPWIGVGGFAPDGARLIRSLKNDLDVGLSGLGVYFARLWKVTGERRFHGYAEDLLARLSENCGSLKGDVQSAAGGFRGLGACLFGVVRICADLGHRPPRESVMAALTPGDAMERRRTYGRWRSGIYAQGPLGFVHALGQMQEIDHELELSSVAGEVLQWLLADPAVLSAGHVNGFEPGIARALKMVQLFWPQWTDEIERSGLGSDDPPAGWHDWMADLIVLRSRNRVLGSGRREALKRILAEGDADSVMKLWLALAARGNGDVFTETAQRISADLHAGYRKEGRWFPEEWCADHYLLSLFNGLPALGMGMLALFDETSRHPFWVIRLGDQAGRSGWVIRSVRPESSRF